MAMQTAAHSSAEQRVGLPTGALGQGWGASLGQGLEDGVDLFRHCSQGKFKLVL